MKSDFEKLVIARKYIAVLEQELEGLKQKVEDQHRENLRLQEDLAKEKARKEKMTPEERLKIKSDLRAQQMNQTVKNLKTKLDKSLKETEQLRAQVIRLKSAGGDA